MSLQRLGYKRHCGFCLDCLLLTHSISHMSLAFSLGSFALEKPSDMSQVVLFRRVSPDKELIEVSGSQPRE